MRRIAVGVGVAVMAAAGWLGSGLRPVEAQSAGDKGAFYTEKVKPIWENRCGRCHMGMNHRGGLSLATRAGLMKGGKDGVILVPGDPSKGTLVASLRHEGSGDNPKPMPPKEKISDAEIAIVEQWVRAGAVMPEDTPH